MKPVRARFLSLAATAAVLALVLAACGGSSPSSGAAPSSPAVKSPINFNQVLPASAAGSTKVTDPKPGWDS